MKNNQTQSKNEFFKSASLTAIFTLMILSTGTYSFADYNACESITLKCDQGNCPIPKFTLNYVDGIPMISGNLKRSFRGKSISVPYEVALDFNGENGLKGSGNVAVDFTKGKNIVRICDYSVNYFSINKNGDGHYKVSYRLPKSMVSILTPMKHKQKLKTGQISTQGGSTTADVGAILADRNSAVAASIAGSRSWGQTNSSEFQDEKEWKDAVCPNETPGEIAQADEVDLNLDYSVVDNGSGCDANEIIPSAFPYDKM